MLPVLYVKTIHMENTNSFSIQNWKHNIRWSRI